ncbi:MAG: L-2-hydroxyglutarate oxidase [Azospirillaceae bacterium]|nr:L-2-hydroxyglutarate oxidase [Azospirillaceae bacterium]
MLDFCIVGGGIVGLATAYTLMERFPGCELVVLEQDDSLCRHQTGHNSGVIHAGVYYAPGSLKAMLCKAGAEATKAFCAENGIPVITCGKLLVATNPLELERMQALFGRARQNGIDCRLMGADELREAEPNIIGLGAIHVSATGIVDYKQVGAALAARITQGGGQVMRNARVTRIEETPGAVVVHSATGTHTARQLIACAGAQADRIVEAAGLETDFQIVPFRGEYFRLPAERAGLINALIYPIPDPDLPFLGIHLTRMIDGGITVGPNAVLSLARQRYPKFAVDVADVARMLAFPGFWRVIANNFRSGLTEMKNSLMIRGYLEACRKYCPSLTVDDLLPQEAGIRAQAVMRDGTLVHDFLLKKTARCIHVCNAPSPAATSALPIGAMIADDVQAQRAAW